MVASGGRRLSVVLTPLSFGAACGHDAGTRAATGGYPVPPDATYLTPGGQLLRGLAAIKKGDEIVMRDGLCGTVRQVRDEFVVVEIADHKKVRLLKSAVSEVLRSRALPRARR